MSAQATTRPEPLVSFVTRKVQVAIAVGQYPPGARLSPNALASEFGVSHIPVREALNSLAAQGYIVHHQSRGFFTRELSPEELKDIYRWRRVLETEAYRAAIKRITDEDVAVMRQLLATMDSLTGHEDRLRYIELNREFHFVAFRRAESPTLLQLLNHLWDVSAPYGAVDLIDSTRGHQDHMRQIQHYEKRDLRGLLKAMDEHRSYRLAMVAHSDTVQGNRG